MISAEAPDFTALARRLAAKAGALAEARAESATRKTRGDPVRWRKARLLWPLITKGPG